MSLVDHVRSPELVTILLLEASWGAHSSRAGVWEPRRGREGCRGHTWIQALRNSHCSAFSMGPHWGRGGSPAPLAEGPEAQRGACLVQPRREERSGRVTAEAV